MKITNKSKFPLDKAKSLMQFVFSYAKLKYAVKPLATVDFKNRKGNYFSGRYYSYNGGRILCSFGGFFPHTWKYHRYKTAVTIPMWNEDDSFIALFAHEFFHHIQHCSRRGFSELEAMDFARLVTINFQTRYLEIAEENSIMD